MVAMWPCKAANMSDEPLCQSSAYFPAPTNQQRINDFIVAQLSRYTKKSAPKPIQGIREGPTNQQVAHQVLVPPPFSGVNGVALAPERAYSSREFT